MTRSLQALAPDYDKMSEAELVVCARAGSPDAFRVIMQRCNQRLFRIARGVVRDDAEAEDVLQEAYTRAFENFVSFRAESSLFTWLTSVTLNEARADSEGAASPSASTPSKPRSTGAPRSSCSVPPRPRKARRAMRRDPRCAC